MMIKDFDILTINLDVQYNNLNLTKLFSNLYLVKFLETSMKLFFLRRPFSCDTMRYGICSVKISALDYISLGDFVRM